MENHVFIGSVHKFGNDINTDLISPAQYMEMSNEVIAAHAMEGADPDFPKKVRPGDIIVAGKNFGSGSSRETAPLALKGCGVSVVIAKFFARIFYRNCINIGLPVLICEEADEIMGGDELEVDPIAGRIVDRTLGKVFHCSPLPEHIMKLIACGGLTGFVRQRLEEEE